MTRKKSASGIGPIMLVAIAYGISALYGFVVANIVGVIAAILILVVFFLLIKLIKRRNRLRELEGYEQFLLDKYKNSSVVERILNSEYWVGQTTRQLEDSLGIPDGIDRQILKTKETWKYGKIRKGQFQLRINIENEKVVGWKDKST